MKNFLLLALLLSIAPSAMAQSTTTEVWSRVGIFGAIGINIHASQFDELPGAPSCCPEYSSGTGVGPAVGLFYELLLGGPLELSLRAGFEGRGATLDATESKPVIVGGAQRDAEIRHVLETSIPSVMIEPLLGLRVGGARFSLGPHFGFPTAGEFAQREELVEPETGTYENNRRVRNESSGEIPNLAGFDAGITLGVGYDLPLDREGVLLLTPEVSFTADLTNVTDDLKWRAHVLRIGGALRYELTRERMQEIVARPDTIVTTRTELLGASIRAVGLDAAGTEHPDVTVSVEEFISTNMRPLLNYLFFDEGSSTLPARYRRVDDAAFSVTRLHSLDAIGTYHHLLNIVGERLRSTPSARVTIVGCNAASGADTGLGLSMARATAVRDYLRSVWGIDENRLRVEARGLPSEPSDTSADGRAENRRVEIIADVPAILAPVVTLDTLRSVTPPVLRFRTSVEGSTAQWRVDVAQHGRRIRSFEGSREVPEFIDWNTNADQLAVPSAGDSLHYALRVVGRSGAEAMDEGALAVSVVTLRRKQEERIGDRIIDRYSLILFDFDSAVLDPANAAIANGIRAAIGPGAVVRVTGSTDRIGEDAYNERLSQERARNVARALGIGQGNAVGVGERQLVYDNDQPEGRFYSRTVTIVVETPVR